MDFLLYIGWDHGLNNSFSMQYLFSYPLALTLKQDSSLSISSTTTLISNVKPVKINQFGKEMVDFVAENQDNQYFGY